jgi:hypothetical protein
MVTINATTYKWTAHSDLQYAGIIITFLPFHGRRGLKISVGGQFCGINSPGTQSRRIQNAADDKESTPKTQERNGVELQDVQKPLNYKNLSKRTETVLALPLFYLGIKGSLNIGSAVRSHAAAQAQGVVRAVPLSRPTTLTSVTIN